VVLLAAELKNAGSNPVIVLFFLKLDERTESQSSLYRAALQFKGEVALLSWH
jgi:hypothetical protein